MEFLPICPRRMTVSDSVRGTLTVADSCRLSCGPKWRGVHSHCLLLGSTVSCQYYSLLVCACNYHKRRGRVVRFAQEQGLQPPLWCVMHSPQADFAIPSWTQLDGVEPNLVVLRASKRERRACCQYGLPCHTATTTRRGCYFDIARKRSFDFCFGA